MTVVDRKTIIEGLCRAMCATGTFDARELTDFAEALCSLSYRRWALIDASVEKLRKILDEGPGYITDWTQLDEERARRMAERKTEPPPLVARLRGRLLVLVDGRHRLRAARGATVRLYCPYAQVLAMLDLVGGS